jgi:hypothetical protein
MNKCSNVEKLTKPFIICRDEYIRSWVSPSSYRGALSSETCYKVLSFLK